MANYIYRFTVFTPTYNRSRTLHRVFVSLTCQTFKDFEWLVVDDGSTDDTQVLLKQWQGKSRFPIRVLLQENLGKHIAFNHAVQEAKGFLFLTLDSDDACKPNALERLNAIWEGIPDGVRDGFSGVTVLCEDQHGRLVGDRFPADIFDSDSLEKKYRYRIRGEKWGCHRTEVLKSFPFPNLEGAKFIPESIVWTRIARRYKTRFVNEVLRVYYVKEQNNSLTRDAGNIHPGGKAVGHLEMVNDHFDFFRYAPMTFIMGFIHFGRFSIHNRESPLKMLHKLRGHWRKMIMTALIPIAYLIVVWDRLTGKS